VLKAGKRNTVADNWQRVRHGSFSRT